MSEWFWNGANFAFGVMFAYALLLAVAGVRGWIKYEMETRKARQSFLRRRS